jgi:hypothetical protein
MTKITIKEVVDQCRIYNCDKKVAAVLNCPVTLVEACRPMIYSRGQRRDDLGLNEDTGKHCQATLRYKTEAESIKVASQSLLIKQLETGHHWLNRERFFAAVSKLNPDFGLL